MFLQTDANGKVRVKLTLSKVKSNLVTIEFKGDKYYKETTKKVTEKVLSDDEFYNKYLDALEAIGKGGIHVAGDFVMEKHVEHEVANVETGGIGIQIINGEKTSQPVSDKKELSAEQLARAIENCQEYF
jgi:hypothetical protein